MHDAPLPAGWERYVDPQSGDAYYHHAGTGETTWSHPRGRVGRFVDTLRRHGESARGGGENGDGWPRRALRFLRPNDESRAPSAEPARAADDDASLRRRLAARADALRGDDAADLRAELLRQKDRLARLRAALDDERRRAAELLVASGEGPGARDDASRATGGDDAAATAPPGDEAPIDVTDDLAAAFEAADAALADAATLATCGVDARLSRLLRTAPWRDECLTETVVEAEALEWQARKPDSLWTAPSFAPNALLDERRADDLGAPEALRRSAAPRFPRCAAVGAGGGFPSSDFSDAKGARPRSSDADAASPLPGACWQWVGGWRLEARRGDPEGWLRGDAASLSVAAFDEAAARDAAEPDPDLATLRVRRWRRTRALARAPPPPPGSHAGDRVAHAVASKLLELRAHGAGLAVLAGKLSDQLVETRLALTEAEAPEADGRHLAVDVAAAPPPPPPGRQILNPFDDDDDSYAPDTISL